MVGQSGDNLESLQAIREDIIRLHVNTLGQYHSE